jgi:hypothetical protein
MSEWYTIHDEESVSLSLDKTKVNVLFTSNDWGNVYIEIPVEFVVNALKAHEG